MVVVIFGGSEDVLQESMEHIRYCTQLAKYEVLKWVINLTLNSVSSISYEGVDYGMKRGCWNLKNESLSGGRGGRKCIDYRTYPECESRTEKFIISFTGYRASASVGASTVSRKGWFQNNLGYFAFLSMIWSKLKLFCRSLPHEYCHDKLGITKKTTGEFRTNLRGERSSTKRCEQNLPSYA
jgi:hypothetical protein